jgi:hypothetical protein
VRWYDVLPQGTSKRHHQLILEGTKLRY